MMLLLVILLGIYLRELRTENIYGLLSSLYFVKRGFFMILLLVILLGIYLRELRTENIYLLLSFPLFRKEGARGRFYDFNLSKTNFPIISICDFSAFNAGI